MVAHVIPLGDAHVIPQRDDERVARAGVLALDRHPRFTTGDRGVRLARRTFDVTDVTEILVHWYAGRSQSEVATSLGVDRKTIKKYVAPAIEAGITPGGPAMTTADWAELTGKWIPAVTDTRLRQTTWPQI